MAAADSLKTNLNRVRYTNYYPSDIVVQTGTLTVYNPGNNVVSTQAPQSNNLVTVSTPNTYGKRCIARYVWSIDGTNFNAAEDFLLYSFTVNGSSTLYNVQAIVDVSCTGSTVTFTTGNGTHGNCTTNGAGTYTSGSPVGYTFTIKYALIALDS